jgi:hypothetical protein
MRYKNQGHDFFQARMLVLVLGGALVLLPLVAVSGQNPLLHEEKAPGEEVGTSPHNVVPQEDFTELGVSKVEAIFILRQENNASPKTVSK